MTKLKEIDLIQATLFYGIKINDDEIPINEGGEYLEEAMNFYSETGVGVFYRGACADSGSAIIIEDSKYILEANNKDDHGVNDPDKIDDVDVNIDPKWDGMLKKFCEKHDIKYRNPKWHFGWYYELSEEE